MKETLMMNKIAINVVLMIMLLMTLSCDQSLNMTIQIDCDPNDFNSTGYNLFVSKKVGGSEKTNLNVLDYNKEFLYNFEFISPSGRRDSLACIEMTLEKRIDKDSCHEQAKFVSISHLDKFGMNEEVRWDQKPLTISYYNQDSVLILSGQTGFIQNCNNFWMHPPRQNIFMQNYCAPWPLVSFNKNEWSWSFKFNGNSWQNIVDESWTTVEEFVFKYKIVGKRIFEFKNNEYLCYEILAKGTSSIGENETFFVFSLELGIVHLENKNIDNSRFAMSLIEIR